MSSELWFIVATLRQRLQEEIDRPAEECSPADGPVSVALPTGTEEPLLPVLSPLHPLADISRNARQRSPICVFHSWTEVMIPRSSPSWMRPERLASRSTTCWATSVMSFAAAHLGQDQEQLADRGEDNQQQPPPGIRRQRWYGGDQDGGRIADDWALGRMRQHPECQMLRVLSPSTLHVS